MLNGFGMNLFGWQPDFINDAVQHAARRAATRSARSIRSPARSRELVCELTGFDRAGLCNTGSEAVMAAMRIARTVTGRSTVVMFTGSYHGTFDEVLVRAGRKPSCARPGGAGHHAGHVGRTCRVLDYGTPESLEFIRAHADELAAVLVEPVQSRRPDFQPREFLQRAARDHREVRHLPDLRRGHHRLPRAPGRRAGAVRHRAPTSPRYGKVIGGGFPVGVIAGKRAVHGRARRRRLAVRRRLGADRRRHLLRRHLRAPSARARGRARPSLEHLKAAGPGAAGAAQRCAPRRWPTS